jgi:WD40-like Beta Propeller Repeat
MQLSIFQTPLTRTLMGALLLGGSAAAASCAKGTGSQFINSSGPGGGGSSGSSGGGTIIIGGNGDAGIQIGGGCGGSICTDFPMAPILDGNNVPPNAAQMFGAAGSGGSSGGPCLYEPPQGALFPNNWLRPRFYWTAGSGQALFELRLHSDNEAQDLVVYTTQTKWTMPKDIWTNLAQDLQNAQITVTIRQMTNSGPTAGTGSSFAVAPAPAQGAMVFWSTKSFDANAASTDLQGFQVGDESTVTVLTPTQVQQPVWAGPGDGGNFPNPAALEPVQCIGCHTSTPDGLYVGFTVQWPWPNALASVQADSGSPVGAAPPFLTPGAIANLGPNTNDQNYLGGTHVSPTNNVDNVMLGIQTFSKAHYQTGDRVEVTSVGASLDQPENSSGMFEAVQQSGVTSQLVWINLEWNGSGDAGSRPSAAPGAASNGGWGVLARTGDSNSAGSPNWSHDGTKIAYTSTSNGTRDGRLGAGGSSGTSGIVTGQADVKIIPYSANAGPGGAGGPATSLQGASDPAFNEYFPVFSPDDALVAFDRTQASQDMYQQPMAEVYVVSSSGGDAARLEGNSPAMCSGKPSPGVSNTWPKFAPAPAGGVMPAADGQLYYWITFSSTRGTDPATTGSKPQLYIAGVSVDPNTHAIKTFPAIYLWNQDPTVNNLIPAWDNFAIPNASGGPPR